MRRMLFCKACRSPIAETDGAEIKIRHRGRTIIVRGSVSIQCEKCGKVSFFGEKDIRRLCSDNAAVPAGEASHAPGV